MALIKIEPYIIDATGDFTFNNVTATGNLSSLNANLGNLATANYFSGSGANLTNLPAGNISGQVANALVSGTVYTNAQPNITSVGTLTSLTVTGNVTGGNLVTAGKVYSSEMLNGGTGIYLSAGPAGYINFFTTGGDKASISDTGNIIASNLIANSTVFATTANISGNVNAGNVSGTLLTGTLTTAAQPNITSVGTLTGLTSNGIVNFANTSNTTLGAVGNVRITGGSSGQYLQTDGSGTLTWATVSSGSTSNISNGNSNVNIPAANGNVNISSTGNANILVITGTGANITGTLNVTGDTTVGNLLSSGSGGNITNANVISANTFTASGNITAGNANLGNSVTANYFIGNFYGTANSATTATSATTAGTVTTAAQPNITSTGTLTSLSVSGTGSFGGNVNLNSFNITSLATPVASTDAATKQYVDDVAQGLNVHDAAAAATPDTLANITTGTITYNNGSSGVGANLTTTGTFNLIDGVNVQTNGTRILVKNEANAVLNGVYTWSNATVITRATDYNSVPEVEAGDFIFVSGGTLYDNTGWVQTSTVSAIGTAGNNIEFTQFSGAGTYQAGTGLTLTGSTFSVNASQTQITSVGTLGNLTVTGNATVGNLVTSGSGGTLSNINVVSANTFTASGNITAGNLIGSLANGNSNVNIPSANGNILVTVAGNANIVSFTGVGLSTGLGSITRPANVSAYSPLYAVSNIDSTAPPISIQNRVATGYSSVDAFNSSNLYMGSFGAANPSATLVPALANMVYLSGSASATGVGLYAVNGNVTLSASSNANIVVVTGTGANITGTANITGNANVGNIGGAAGVFTTVTGSLTTAAQPNITSVGSLTGLTVSNATGIVNFTTTANVTLGAVANLHISGGTNAYVLSTDGAGNLSWIAQSGGGGGGSSISNGNSNVNIATANGNITMSAVGNANILTVTGTGVNVAGTLNVTGQSNLGAVGNVKIIGGTANYLLSTDGAGNLSWTAPPAGANVTVDNFTGNGVQTVFTLSTTPTGINQTSVNYNGATVLRTDYTLANANITFSSAPANGSLIEITTINLTSSGGGGTSTAAAVGYSLIFGG